MKGAILVGETSSEILAMQVQALGYVGIGASDLSDWTAFATNWLGMQMVERGNACRAFRMDDRSQRLVVDRSLAEGERYFGFEVSDAAALDARRHGWRRTQFRCGA